MRLYQIRCHLTTYYNLDLWRTYYIPTSVLLWFWSHLQHIKLKLQTIENRIRGVTFFRMLPSDALRTQVQGQVQVTPCEVQGSHRPTLRKVPTDIFENPSRHLIVIFVHLSAHRSGRRVSCVSMCCPCNGDSRSRVIVEFFPPR